MFTFKCLFILSIRYFSQYLFRVGVMQKGGISHDILGLFLTTELFSLLKAAR